MARGFPAVWSNFFPMLTPAFIIAFNEAYVHRIPVFDGEMLPISTNTSPNHSDVLAEFSFRLAATAYLRGISVKEASDNLLILREACEEAMRKIRGLREVGQPDSLELTETELAEGVRLAGVHEHFYSLRLPKDEVVFSPGVRGCGVLNSCRADLSIGNTLYEVKTVSRNFQSRDLRQLLVYLALQDATSESRWQFGGLMNPRVGVFCRFSIEWLVARLSGGRAPKLVFLDFLEALSRDTVMDRRF